MLRKLIRVLLVFSFSLSLSLHRVQAGHCFHLFTQFQLRQLAEYQQPEMLRTPLEELVLQIKILKLGQAEGFLQKAIEAPERKAVNNAIRCLKDLVSVWN